MIKYREPKDRKAFKKIKQICQWMFQEFLPKTMQKKLMDQLKKIILNSFYQKINIKNLSQSLSNNEKKEIKIDPIITKRNNKS